MTEEKKKLLAEIINALFPGDEGDIEHVDMSFKNFVDKIRQLAKDPK